MIRQLLYPPAHWAPPDPGCMESEMPLHPHLVLLIHLTVLYKNSHMTKNKRKRNKRCDVSLVTHARQQKGGTVAETPEHHIRFLDLFSVVFHIIRKERERERKEPATWYIYRTQQTPPPTITVRHNCVTEQCRQCWPTRIHFPPQLGQKHYPVGVYNKTFFWLILSRCSPDSENGPALSKFRTIIILLCFDNTQRSD